MRADVVRVTGAMGSDDTLHLGGPSQQDEPTAPQPTTSLDVQVQRTPSQLALIFLAVGAACFLIGIAAASVARTERRDPVLAHQDIGPSGGIVRFDGGELRIPEGALSSVETIEVRRSVIDRRVRVDPGGDDESLVFEPGRLVAYRFTPTDVTFARSVELTFRLPVRARNGTAFARRSDGRIVFLEGTVDVDRGTATTKVRDFRFAPRARCVR